MPGGSKIFYPAISTCIRLPYITFAITISPIDDSIKLLVQYLLNEYTPYNFLYQLSIWYPGPYNAVY